MTNPASIFRLLKNLWDRSDQIVALLDNLSILSAAGTGMEVAGQAAKDLRHAINGDGGSPIHLHKLLKETSDAIARSAASLKDVAGMVRTAGEEIGRIRIPTIEPTYTHIDLLNMKILTGLEIGEIGLFDAAAAALKTGALRLDEVGGSLGEVVGQLRQVEDQMAKTGDRLDSVGAKLCDVGQQLDSAYRAVSDAGRDLASRAAQRARLPPLLGRARWSSAHRSSSSGSCPWRWASTTCCPGARSRWA